MFLGNRGTYLTKMRVEKRQQGIEESLESVDADKDGIEEAADTHCGKCKRKLTSHVWAMFEVLHLVEDKKKKKKRYKLRVWCFLYV